jgi:sugar lactone lactonase YvrE
MQLRLGMDVAVKHSEAIVRRRLRPGAVAAVFAGAAVAVAAVAAATGETGVTGRDKITTFAGQYRFGTGGFSGDDGPAAKAELSQPHGVAVDRQGNVYIADSNNHRVRKVSAGGTITTIAGGGPGFSGDSGPATSAFLDHPNDVAVDAQGYVYVTTQESVYRVSAGGLLTRLAGTLVPGFSGDGGPASAAQLSSPDGVEVDGHGNVYIADRNNNRVRKVTASGTISTIAGTGVAGFSGDGGPATSAKLNTPEGVAVDGHGNVYISDRANARVRKVSASGTITTVAGNGKQGVVAVGGRATSVPLYNPWGVAVDAQGNLYVDTDFNVYKVSPGGKITKLAGLDPNLLSKGSGDGGPAASSTLAHAAALAFDGHGNLYIADVADAAIRKILKGSAATPRSAKKKVAHPAKKVTRPSGSKTAGSAKTLLRAAGSLEIDLGQMARDRAKLKSALAAVSTCSLTPNAAAGEVAAVADGRQRLLNQLLKLNTPSAQVAQIASLLRQSLARPPRQSLSNGRNRGSDPGATRGPTGDGRQAALRRRLQSAGAAAPPPHLAGNRVLVSAAAHGPKPVGLPTRRVCSTATHPRDGSTPSP